MKPLFQVGDTAIYTGPADHGLTAAYLNARVTIRNVNEPFEDSAVAKHGLRFASEAWPREIIYVVVWPVGTLGYVPECQLKRPPPDLQKFKDECRPCGKSFDEVISHFNKSGAAV